MDRNRLKLISHRVKKARSHMNQTDDEFCESSGISYAKFRAIEDMGTTGSAGLATLGTFKRISDYTGMSLLWLLGIGEDVYDLCDGKREKAEAKRLLEASGSNREQLFRIAVSFLSKEEMKALEEHAVSYFRESDQ